MKLPLFAFLLATAAAPAAAQEVAPPPAIPQAQPAAAPQSAADAPICTDRPTKANAPCTVPAGALQLETDLANWTRTDVGGVRSDLILYTNPTLKLGLTDRADVEVNWAPYEELRTRAAGTTTTLGGVGDVFVRVKDRVTADSSKVQIALIPWVKIPTAKPGLGNREVEGGVAAPVAVTLPDNFTLTFGPEGDLLLNASGSGRHFNLVNLVNLARSFGKLTVAGELWSDVNFDPAGRIEQYSADVAMSYPVTKRLQIDAGANFGLNRNTPDVQLYAGVSTRF